MTEIGTRVKSFKNINASPSKWIMKQILGILNSSLRQSGSRKATEKRNL